MKRCNHCFRYAVGQPTYCPYCGRTYDVRICARGHKSPRGVQFCAECGSDELSEAAPAESLLAKLSRLSLQVCLGMFCAVLLLSVVLAALRAIDWQAVTPNLVLLGLAVAFLYWTTTLLPGPVKRIGRAAGKQAGKMFKGKRERQ